jgi:TfoX/Sxy family transcriptional regulator of competence genes
VAYDADLADRVRGTLGRTVVIEKKMFGGLAFLINGNIAVAASGQGGLLVRVDPIESDRLLDEPGTEPMQMGDRAPMAGWLHVSDRVVATEAALNQWVQRGVRYAKTLPPK